MRLPWLPFLAADICGSGHAGNVYLPTDIAVTMTANPSTELRTGQIIGIVLTVTNRGPQPADVLILNSSPFFHEFSVTYIDAVACYQFGGTVGEGDPHPIFAVEWFIAGVPDTGMQPFAVGETRTCNFRLTLMADAPAVTPFTFAVSTYDPDIDASNSIATVYLSRAIPTVQAIDARIMALLIVVLFATGAAAVERRAGSASLRS